MESMNPVPQRIIEENSSKFQEVLSTLDENSEGKVIKVTFFVDTVSGKFQSEIGGTGDSKAAHKWSIIEVTVDENGVKSLDDQEELTKEVADIVHKSLKIKSPD